MIYQDVRGSMNKVPLGGTGLFKLQELSNYDTRTIFKIYETAPKIFVAR